MSVENLSKHTGKGVNRSPEQCLQDCLNNLIGKKGAFKEGKKILVIALDDSNGCYRVNWAQAGMKMSETLALCDVMKQLALSNMEYSVTPEDLNAYL